MLVATSLLLLMGRQTVCQAQAFSPQPTRPEMQSRQLQPDSYQQPAEAPLDRAPQRTAPPVTTPQNTTLPTADAPRNQAPRNSAPIAWRQNVFSIPFRVNRSQQSPDAPHEIQLFVSQDRGQTWQLAERGKPTLGSFTYRAAHDGLYWFALRTVDRQGNISASSPQETLQVQVDTVPPELNLQASQGSSGEVTVAWQAVDPLLKFDSLKIEYQTVAEGPWRSLALGHNNRPASGTTRSGSASWWPTEQTHHVTLRAEVYDRAGNRAINQAQVTLSQNPAPSQPARSTAAMPNRGRQASGAVRGGNQNHGFRQDPPASATAQYPARSGTPARNASISRNVDNFPPPGNYQPVPDSLTPNVTGPRGIDGSQQWLPDATSQAPLESRRNSEPGMPADQGNIFQAQRQPDNSSSFPGGVGNPHNTNRGAGPQPRMVNTPVVDLQYQLDFGEGNPTQDTIEKVELWSTRDRGQTWQIHGVDNDTRSPIRARLSEEGSYGFRIVMYTASGFSSPQPRPGDPPEVIVGYDNTRPFAQLLSVQPKENQLTIRWEANDAHLGERPVSLSYSAGREGPWMTIANDINNTGVYLWQLNPSLPKQVYLRIDVQDRAGNATAFQTTEPAPLKSQQQSPGQAQLNGFRPVPESAFAPRN